MNLVSGPQKIVVFRNQIFFPEGSVNELGLGSPEDFVFVQESFFFKAP